MIFRLRSSSGTCWKIPNQPRALAAAPPSQPKGFGAICGGNLGFSTAGSAGRSCLTGSRCLVLPCRTSHSRAKAEAAVTAAQKAQEEARIARITAKEFSPSFQHRENGQSGSHPCHSLPLRAPQNSPAWRLSLCPQLPIPTGALGVGKLPGSPGLGRFSTRLSVSSNSTLFRAFFLGSPLFTPEHPHFLVHSP